MSRKAAIFYTFLCCFIVTFVVTMLGIIEVIKIRDGYLNVLFGSLILELVAAVITLFRKTSYFDDEKKEVSTTRLIIHSASYGGDEKQIDVTEAVRSRVSGDTLEIAAGNHLGGDPCFGVGKKLKIDYSFGKIRKTKIIWEGQVDILP